MNAGSSTFSIPASVGVDDEQGRQPVGAVDHVRHHDVDRGVVAAVTNHFSPLIRKPASVRSAVAAIREGSEPASRSVTA